MPQRPGRSRMQSTRKPRPRCEATVLDSIKIAGRPFVRYVPCGGAARRGFVPVVNLDGEIQRVRLCRRCLDIHREWMEAEVEREQRERGQSDTVSDP